MTADDILAAARSLIGTPFRHQGRGPDGCDCAGLLVLLARALGIPHEDVDGYSRRPSSGLLESALESQPGLVRVTGAPQAGDFLLMRFTNAPQHLAVCGGDTLIHAWENAGKVCEHRFSPLWKARVVRIYRVKELNHE